jgi:uncharacterized membrane protein
MRYPLTFIKNLILLVVVIVIAGILLYKRLPKSPKSKAEELNETALKAVAERLAKGEITKTSYNAIFNILEQLDDETIETAKLRLAKGEINFNEYVEIYNILIKNQAI